MIQVHVGSAPLDAAHGGWQMQRNFLATLAVSQGVPMLLAGDEMGRTQNGNNNAYCQDNEINWIDWAGAAEQQKHQTRFTAKLFALRRRFPVLQSDKYRHRPSPEGGDSIEWLNSQGGEMSPQDWHDHDNKLICYLLTESASKNSDTRYLLVIFNAFDCAQECQLPAKLNNPWHLIIDTADVTKNHAIEGANSVNSAITLAAHSMQILSSDPSVSGALNDLNDPVS